MPQPSERARVAATCAGLALAALVVHGRAIGFEFLATDDTDYVVGNPYVRAGLSLPGFAWAWTTTHASNWFPLTWLSLMLDAELFGTGPAGFHATNVLLHVANVLLCFAALRRLTGRHGPSALAAALLALHPMHVESVAWIPERKDVLSLGFGLASTWAYAGYARSGSRGAYAAVTALFACGLMSKPTLVTLPCVFLLLDRWPLGRLRSGARAELPGVAAAPAPARSAAALVREKLPWLALSLGSVLVTLQVQARAMSEAAQVALPQRLANAAVSIARYLGKLVWPDPLGPLYAHPNLPGGTPWTGGQVLAALALLAALTALLLALARRRPFLGVGWLWFLGTLVPMLGLVQVGRQALADRYAYLPYLGLYLLLAWSLAELAARLAARRAARALLATAVALGLVGLGARARVQTACWRDSEAFHACGLRVAPDSPVLLAGLGSLRFQQGRIEEALGLYRDALSIWPEHATSHANLGVALASRGRVEEALAALGEALRIDPGAPAARLNLAKLLHAQGRLDEALVHYRRAAGDAGARPEAHELLAGLLAARGHAREAQLHFAAAIEQRQRGVRLEPADAGLRLALARSLREAGRAEAALEHFERALELAPDAPAALRDLAQLLATHPEPSRRDPERAIALALRASRGRGRGDVESWMVLAQAYASGDRFEEALGALDRGLALSESRGEGGFTPWLRARRAEYAERAERAAGEQ